MKITPDQTVIYMCFDGCHPSSFGRYVTIYRHDIAGAVTDVHRYSDVSQASARRLAAVALKADARLDVLSVGWCATIYHDAA